MENKQRDGTVTKLLCTEALWYIISITMGVVIFYLGDCQGGFNACSRQMSSEDSIAVIS